MLDILMVTYKSDAFERAALASIRSKTDIPFRLSVIDNNSENRSLTLIWNEFARQSSADYLCYANPDILCGAGWANRLFRAFDCIEVVVANPSTPYNPNSAGDPCSRLQGLVAPEVFNRVGDVNPEQLDVLGQKLPPVTVDDPFCYGFCYCVRRKWLAAQGYFDESFPFYGQESEFNYRTLLAGKRVVCVKDSVVFHRGQGSSGGSKTPSLLEATRKSFAQMGVKHPAWPVMFGLYA